VGPCLATNAARFAAAYITLVDANAQGFSTGTTIPFKRQAGMAFFDVGNQQLKGKDRKEFWAYTVVFGYEPGADEDFDPNDEGGALGVTQKSLAGLFHSFSVIYLEPNREAQFSLALPAAFMAASLTNSLRAQYVQEIYASAAHEIGHAPGSLRLSFLDHNEKDLMAGGLGRHVAFFSAKTLLRFRQATQWTR
jgi:hypothetical protein